MILESLDISTFGGLSQTRLIFKPGVNVVLGPNEAGKSTVFHSIEHALLTPAKLPPSRFTRTLGSYLPVSGGDTLRVALAFRGVDGEYGLTKRWGADSGAEFLLPGGEVVTDEKSIEEAMLGLLPASSAVLRTVLLSYQSAIEQILSDLESSTEAMFDLQEILRRSLQSADGIPVDKFRAQIEELVRAHYSRWDRKLDGPEQGRGLGNPWVKNRGLVLDAWYAMTELADRRRRILELEDELAKTAALAAVTGSKYEEIEGFLSRHRRAADEAALLDRNTLALEKHSALEKRYADDYDRWPKIEERAGVIPTDIQKCDIAIAELTAERSAAVARQEHLDRQKEAVIRLERARQYHQDLQTALDTLGRHVEISAEYVAGLDKLQREVEATKRNLQSGSVHLDLTARASIDLEVKKGIQKAENITIGQGESVSLRSDGGLSVRHPDWTMHVYPGESDFTALTSRLEELSARLREELKIYDLVSVDEARTRQLDYKTALGNVDIKKSLLDEVLQGDTIEELEKTVGGSAAEANLRPLEAIVEELAAKNHTVAGLKHEQEDITRKAEELVVTYEKRESLLDLMLESREIRKKLEGEIGAAADLPEGYADWETFLNDYSVKQKSREALLAEKHDLETRLAALDATLPEVSAEELDLELADATRKYAEVRREAAALEHILDRTEALLDNSGHDISDRLKSTFETYLARTTDNTYNSSRFGASLPAGLVRGDGSELSFTQLSAGTKDSFALALRLAMADFFLADGDGFFILDDPLVDMDAGRRASAAAAIAEFAAGKQTILFTCHPEHAALFSGATVLSIGAE